MKVRRAVPADAVEISSLYRTLVGDTPVNVLPARLEQLSHNPLSHLLVAENVGAVLGTAHLTLCLDAMFGMQPYGVVENIVVDPKQRGRGIGHQLLAAVDAICLEHNCSKIMLLSSTEREDAHRFFEQNAYQGDRKRGFVKYRRSFGNPFSAGEPCSALVEKETL